MIIIDDYKIELRSWFGDYEDCVVAFIITTPEGLIKEESRMGSASKKGIFKTSIYGMKIKVNLETHKIEV